MKTITMKSLIYISLLFSIGCATQMSPRSHHRAQLREDKKIQQESDVKLRGKITDLELAVTHLEDEVQQIETSQHNYASQEINRLYDEINRLEQKLAALEATREADKQEIIDRLSKKMADIVNQTVNTRPAYTPPAKPVRRSTPIYAGSGYEHIVSQGETLSAIAAAYNVSSDTLIQVNNLTNPNSIRVGQKLFIPE